MVHHLLADDTSEKTWYTTFMPPPPLSREMGSVADMYQAPAEGTGLRYAAI